MAAMFTALLLLTAPDRLRTIDGRELTGNVISHLDGWYTFRLESGAQIIVEETEVESLERRHEQPADAGAGTLTPPGANDEAKALAAPPASVPKTQSTVRPGFHIEYERNHALLYSGLAVLVASYLLFESMVEPPPLLLLSASSIDGWSLAARAVPVAGPIYIAGLERALPQYRVLGAVDVTIQLAGIVMAICGAIFRVPVERRDEVSWSVTPNGRGVSFVVRGW